MSKKACALNTSPEIFYIDHIAPLASLLNIPLIATDEKNARLAEKYYPEVHLRYTPDLSDHLDEVAKEFDILIGCDYWAPHQKELFSSLYQKEMRLIFCPHGQSDKGYETPTLAPYGYQEEILIYGNLMREMLSDLNLWDRIPNSLAVGNFRLRYYQKYRDRMLLDAEREIFSHLNPENQTLLYAPTWKDGDKATTFFDCIEKLVSETPSNWNVIVKIHPLLPARDPALFYRLSILEEKQDNIVFVHEFPMIYPLLEKMDAYLGDYSSIGYDALAFQKPMFFLTQPHLRPGRLHTCGKILDISQHLFDQIEAGITDSEILRSRQEELYKNAFAENANLLEASFGMV